MRPLRDAKLHLVTSLDDANAMQRWLSERREILAVDTETTGLTFWTPTDDLRLVQLGDAETGWAVPWHDWGGLVKQLLNQYTEPIVGHNLKFDSHWLEGRNVKLNRLDAHDTRILAHLVDPDAPTGLKPLGARYVDPSAAGGDEALKHAMAQQGWDWATVPVDFKIYWGYGAMDTVLTARLYSVLRPLAEPYARVYELERQVQWAIADMERRGMLVDQGHVLQKQQEIQVRVTQLKREAQELHGVENLTSETQIIAKLCEAGVMSEQDPTAKRTPAGRLSLDKEVLERLSGQHPLVDMKREASSLIKLNSSYLSHYTLEFCDADGRVHPQLNQLGAKTGRMSSSFQTLPRGDEPEALVVRDSFIAKAGHKLISCDLDQIELRLAAHFSQDPTLVKVLTESDDPFTGMARELFHDDTIDKKDIRRFYTKQGTYSKMYGAGSAKFAVATHLAEDQAAEFYATYDERFPGLRQFDSYVQETARQREREGGVAYVRTLLGRRQVLTKGEGHYKLTNYIIQGSAADLFKEMCRDLHQSSVGEYMLLPVHDELIFEVPDEHVRDAVKVIEEGMTRDDLAVPVKAAAAVVSRWGDKSRGHIVDWKDLFR